MNSHLASLMSRFLVDNLRNSPAITRDLRLESEYNEPRLSLVQNESEVP